LRLRRLDCFKLSLKKALAAFTNHIVAIVTVKKGRKSTFVSTRGVEGAVIIRIPQRPMPCGCVQEGVVKAEGARVFVKMRGSRGDAAQRLRGGIASRAHTIEQGAAIKETLKVWVRKRRGWEGESIAPNSTRRDKGRYVNILMACVRSRECYGSRDLLHRDTHRWVGFRRREGGGD